MSVGAARTMETLDFAFNLLPATIKLRHTYCPITVGLIYHSEG